MKIQIVGVQQQDYTLDSGYSFKGVKIHAIDLTSAPAGLSGNLVTSFRIAADSELASVQLVPGAKYTVYFDQKSALDFIQRIPEGGVK